MAAEKSNKGKPLYEPGDMVDHFRVVRLIGRGGMGDVYLARDTRLGRKVALKVVRAAAQDAPAEMKRFLFEARTTARFAHPHIVTIYAVGLHRGHPYLALEYLDGQNLRERMDAERLSIKESLRVCLAIAEALAEAHAHDVQHRDLKPENVLIPRDGRLRVVDFGLAEVVGKRLEMEVDPGDGTANTLSDALVQPTPESGPEGQRRRTLQGTPAYMSPEQWMGKESTAASDVWALGLMLYELILGRRPYRAGSVIQLAAQVVSPEPVPSLAAVDGVTHVLADFIADCLDKAPAKRPTAPDAVDRLRQLVAGGRARGRRGQERNPFRGLQTFTEKHADLFFGRDADLDAFMERIREEPVLPVVGPSGAGKSSFIQAGVVPRLREQGPLVLVQLRPGSRPFRNLAARLLPLIRMSGEDSASMLPTLEMDTGDPALANTAEHSDREQLLLHQQLTESPHLLFLLLDRVATKLKSKVLLFVDQLEELYTLGKDAEHQQRFMEAICSAADDPAGPCRVIVTVREDFLSRLSGGPAVRAALSRVTVMSTPEPSALADTLTKPLEVMGYSYDDPTLVDQMVRDAGRELASLPLLQFTAHMLWKQRDRQNRLLTRAAYEAIGGVAGALATHADGVLEGLSREDERVAREILLRLVTPEGTRRVLSWSRLVEGLGDGAEAVLGRLIAARIISSRKAREEQDSDTELELVHESLIHSWARLSRWIERSSEDLAFLYDVEQSALVWEKRGSRDDEVWQGEALAEALRTLSRCSATIPEVAGRFLEAGRRLEIRRVRRKRALILGAAGILALVMVVLVYQRNQADAQRQEARRRSSQAQREGARAALTRGNPQEARAKLRGSLETQDSALARVLWRRLRRNPLIWKRNINTMVHAVAYSPDGKTAAAACENKAVYLFEVSTGQSRVVRGFPDQVTAVAFSPDGELLVAGTWSGQVLVRDLRSDKVRVFHGHRGQVLRLTVSPDGKLLTSVGNDRTLRLWNLTDSDPPRVLRPAEGRPFGVDFSPDGKLLASGLSGAVQLWDLQSGEPLRRLSGHRGQVVNVDFSPDGSRLVSAGVDRTVRMWRSRDGAALWVARGHNGAAMDVQYGPKGKLVVSTGRDNVVRLWDAASGAQVNRFGGHSGQVTGVRFSPDGTMVLSGSRDQTVRLWQAATRQETLPRRGHGAPVHSVNFSPDGKQLASAGFDRTVRLWDVASGAERTVLRGHEDTVVEAVFGREGSFLASAGMDGAVRLWDLRSAGTSRVLGAGVSPFKGLAISPDGALLAAGGLGRSGWVWDVHRGWRSTGQRLHLLRGHTNLIFDVSFSPDSALLATASQDRTVRLWDLKRGETVATLSGHEGPMHGAVFSPDGKALATCGRDGTVRLWTLDSGAHRVVLRKRARAYAVSFAPDGRRLGTAWSDRTATLTDLTGGTSRTLSGHRSEVNHLQFSPDGALVATGSDDGTVRLWRADTGQAQWRSPALLASRGTLVSHRGWVALGGGAATPAAASASGWGQALERRAVIAGEATGGRTLCVATRDSHLELWDTATDRRLLDEEVEAVSQLEALDQGCLLLADGVAALYTRQGAMRKLRAGAEAVALDQKRLLVAGEGKVHLFDLEGTPLRTLDAPSGVRSLARAHDYLALGFDDGNIELVPLRAGQRRPSFSFEDVPASPVVRLVQGPRGTLIAGYSSGHVGLWQLENGSRLEMARLHGPVVHVALRGPRLYAATELGDALELDLSTFALAYCDLMRQVWREVPVVWENGLPVGRPRPRKHRCLRK